MAGISLRALTGAVQARLQTPELVVFRGEILREVNGKVVATPPLVGDETNRVAQHAILYPSPGTPSAGGQDVADTFTSLDWLLQVTLVAGYSEDLDAAIDHTTDRLLGWAPVIEGIQCSGLRPPVGFDPGPARRDDNVKPPRHWMPLQYRLTATR